MCKDNLPPEAEAHGTKAAREPIIQRVEAKEGDFVWRRGHTINVEHREPARLQCGGWNRDAQNTGRERTSISPDT